MLDVMLDLETMGTNPQAAIAAVGAVEFNISTGRIGERFYEVICLESAVAHGGIMEASTVLWWLKQSDEARSMFGRSGIHIKEGLYKFSEWMRGRGLQNSLRVWGNGAAFDNVILASAYRNLGIPLPWQHWNDRCYRTVKAQYPTVRMQRTGIYHNAVDDAESQARHLISMLSPSTTTAPQAS